MLGEVVVCHLGPIREGCLGEEARELGKGRRAEFGRAEEEKVRASRQREWHKQKHGGRKVALNDK